MISKINANSHIPIAIMKTYNLLFLFLTCLISYNSYSQIDTVLIPNYVNIATLVVDYDTYQFEGGDLSFYSCTSCNNDSLPFAIDVEYPCDFGGITFKISSTLDTIFDASIVWMGTGIIHYPESFSTSYPFTSASALVEQDSDIVYWGFYGDTIVDTALLNKADSAWEVIDDLEITNAFSKIDHKFGIYLYPPTVGIFNPAAAKWVIFLYANVVPNNIESFIKESEDIVCFPNPAKDKITISKDIINKDVAFYKIVNQYGSLIKEGELHSSVNQISISNIPGGLYYLEMINSKNEEIVIKKLIIE